MTKKRKILPIILVICLVGLGVYFYLSSEGNKETKEVFMEDGEYSFRVSSAEGVYPKFISGKFSKRPMDVIAGVDKELEASIDVEDPDGISRVWLMVVGPKEDFKQEINLELSEGDLYSGTWLVKFEVPENMGRIFWTNFYVENKKGRKNDLSLDWRPGATCPVSTSGNHTFGNCNCAGGEVVGTNNGQITVTGTVNLSGVSGSPAYMIYGTKVIFSGGKIVFSAHVSGKATAILIKKGNIDSVKNKAAAICAYYDNIKCNPDASKYCSGTNGPTATSYVKHHYYRCSSGSCSTLTATDDTCATCKYCQSGSCSNYSSGESCGTCKYCQSGGCVNVPKGQDPNNQCGASGCYTGYCNGSAACEKCTWQHAGGPSIDGTCSQWLNGSGWDNYISCNKAREGYMLRNRSGNQNGICGSIAEVGPHCPHGDNGGSYIPFYRYFCTCE